MLGFLIYAVCGTLTAAGLWLSFRSLRRRRYAAGLRTASVALLPMALAMTGVARFVVNMTFNPIAWMGLGVTGLAVVLFMSARFVEGRGESAGGGEAPAESPAAVEPAASAPALPASTAKSKKGNGNAGAGGGASEDFSDIEAILKKHGI